MRKPGLCIRRRSGYARYPNSCPEVWWFFSSFLRVLQLGVDEKIRSRWHSLYIMTIKMHEKTYKQFRAATIQDSSVNFQKLSWNQKELSRNKSSAVMELSCNHHQPSCNHHKFFSCQPKDISRKKKKIAVANQNQQLSVTITIQKPSDSYHSETNNQTSSNPILLPSS